MPHIVQRSMNIKGLMHPQTVTGGKLSCKKSNPA